MPKRTLAFVLAALFSLPGQADSQCQPTPDTSGMGALRAFHVPGESMAPTIARGNFVLVDTTLAQVTTPPERGDLVVFKSTEEPGQIVISRLIAYAGDTVLMHSGRVILNHMPLAEPYAHTNLGKSANPFFRKKMRQWQERFRPYPTQGEYEADLQDWGPLVLPEHAMLVLGDNRDDAYDGRYYGFVPDTNIIGRAALAVDTALRCVRWSRPISVH